MHQYCHRCGEALATEDGGSSFCAHCGAPQLYLTESQNATDAEGESTGILPPPRPRQIEWKTAILCAAGVAGVAALLSVIATRIPALSLLSWLWTLSGAGIVMSLYQRRRPQAWVDAGIGARIGVMAGLALVLSIAVSMAVTGLVARYGLHAMGTFDSELKAQLDKAAAMNPRPAEAMRYIKMPEFKAGIMLAGFAMMSGFVMVLSAIGGALSGLLRTRRS
ncbi:hypothetical protein [Edaphobacter flagellatus]|uniref:hypothetical protein n=1 Tax=Edaphobacter flagellatus TaxID=1933044 RepID=UPI0021B1825D|nr:hypothetical protein [Edaphobacter flagellatus]